MSKSDKNIVIVDGFRTPFVPSGQNFQNTEVDVLGALLLQELIERTQIPLKEVDEMIISNIISPQQSLSSSIALQANFPKNVFTTTSRGMNESVFSAMIKIQSGLSSVVIAGGVENMSHAPISLTPGITKIIKNILSSTTWKEKIKQTLRLQFSDLKWAFKDKDFTFWPSKKNRGLIMDSISGFTVLKRAESLSKKFHISRKEQDEYSLNSFQKNSLWQKQKKWKEEVVSIFPPTDFEMVEKDNYKDLSLHHLVAEKTFFDYGVVTPGNSSFSADGGVLLLMMCEEKARALGYKPLVSISSFAWANEGIGEHYGLGALCASIKVLKNNHLQLKDIDLFEINESSAAEALTYLKVFNSAQLAEKYLNGTYFLGEITNYNVNGGSLALGHPISVTTSRMILNMAREMNRRKVKWGLVATNTWSGQAGAFLLKNTFF